LPARDGDLPDEPEGSDEGADGNPSNNSDTDETTAGTIIIDSPDGVASVTINGVLVTGVVGQVIPGEFGNLTITGFSGQNILYSYTLTDNTSGDDTHDDFSVVLTDEDGDTATATLTIDIIDDVPTARDDTDAVIKGDTSTDGNVMTGVGTTSAPAGVDTVGADDAEVTGVHAGTSGSFTGVPDGGVTVVGQFGDLTIFPDGSYTYTLHAEVGDGGNDVFTYQLTDGDGDTDPATLTITVPPDLKPIVGPNPTVLLDDDALAGGNPGGTGDDPDAANVSGQLSGSGGDAPLTFSVQLTGAPAGFTYVSGGAGIVLIQQGGVTVLTVTVGSDGSYSVVQNAPIDHAAGGDENNQSFTINYTVTDVDGDAANGTLNINVDDDTPVADPESSVGGLVDEDDLPAGNNDNAAGDDDPGNADGDGDGTTTGGAAGSLAALFSVGADAPLQNFGLLADTSGLPVLHSNGVLVTYAVVGNVLTASAGGSTVFTLTVNADGSWVFDLEGQLDHPVAGTEDDLLLDLSSIITAEDADGDPATAADGTFVITVDDDLPVPAVEPFVGGLVDEDDLPTGNDDNAAGDDDPGNADGDNDGTTTGGNAGSLLSLFSFGADQPGSVSLSTDTSGLPALTSGAVAVTYAVVGNVLTASAGGSTVFTLTVNADGSWVFDLEGQLDHPTADTEDNLFLDFSSIIVGEDADGDTATAPEGSFVVTVDDDLPVAANDTDTVGEPGTTATGNVITDNALGDQGDGDNGADSAGADQPGSITDVVSNNEPGNTDTDADPDVFEIQGEFGVLVMNADGSYTYTRDANTPGGGQDVFTYTLTDADGDSVTATLTITLADDRPVATTSAATVDDEGLGGGILGGAGDLDANVGETTPSASEAVYNGTLGGSPGDGTTTFFFPASLDGDVVVIGQENVTLDVSPDGLTITGTGPRGLLFTIQITDAEAGDYTLTLNDNVLHETLNGLAGDNTENNATLVLDYQMEDADGDLSLSPGQLTITFDDDIPTLSNVQPGSGVDLDETDAGSPGGFPINDTSAGAVISATQAFGADGAAAANSVVYGLAITGGPGSGLQTAQGNFAITLVAIDSDTIQGQYQNGGTQVAFTIQMNANGTVTLTQNVPLEHLQDGGPAFFNDTLDLTGLINATVTITDADGDSASASAPIGDNLVFFDDGPDAQADGQATLDQLVLDESPVGTETDGDSDPAGLATVQANFADNFVSPVDYGGDGAGTTAYSLSLSADGIGSGLYALDNTDTETVIDGYGQGDEITLSLSPDGLTITGSAGSTDYFTISINPATGVVTFTQLANVWHADTVDDDDTSSLMTDAAANIQVVQTVTDSDGDFDTASVNIGQGVFHIEDDGPEILLATDAQGDNTGLNPTATGDFAFDIGTDSPNGGNDDIFVDPSSVVIEINNVAIDPADITFTDDGEDADFANYSFEFPYDTGAGGIVTATGTLVFDKNAGTYTVTLTSGPIEGFSTLQTAQGTAFVGYELNDDPSDPDVLDNTQPQIAVTTILEETDPGVSGDGFYVQFTGFTAGNGSHETIDYDLVDPSTGNGVDASWTEGELFSEGTGATALTQSWVSVSNESNGVGGDTVNGPDALNFSLYSSDPGGTFGGTPTASASDMFLVFDGTDSGDDFIVVLKLFDPDSGEYTTKSIVIEGSDIYFFGAAEEAATVAALAGTPYEGVVADIVALGGSNNNDGLVIIESNDYNTGSENWVIVGAQIVNTNAGVSGTGINLDGDVGDDGNSTGTQAFSVVDDSAPMKITNIGFLAGTSNDQAMEFSFDVTITDADGDSETTSLTATIGDPVAPALLPLSAESSESSTDTSSFSLLASDSQDQQLQKTAANSNTLTLAAAVAAVGVAETQAAAAHDNGKHGQQAEEAPVASQQFAAPDSSDGDSSNSAVSNEAPEAANDSAPVESSSRSSSEAESDHVLDDSAAKADDQSSDLPAANDQGPASSSVEASPAALAVGMPSAEALQAAGVAGHGQHGGSVEQIVAEALGQGNASAAVDALLNALPGGNGAVGALANLASPAANSVPGGDMSVHGAFGHGADMMMKMGAEMLHHDAVQPAVNG